MRRCLARLTVAVTNPDPGLTHAAAAQALAVLDWTRYRCARGQMNRRIYASADMPRGYALCDGRGNVLVSMANLPLVLSAPAQARVNRLGQLTAGCWPLETSLVEDLAEITR